MNRAIYIYLILFLLFLAAVITTVILLLEIAPNFAVDGFSAVLNGRGAICLMIAIISIWIAGILFLSPMTTLRECVQTMLVLIYLMIFFYPKLDAVYTTLVERFVASIPVL